MLLSLDHNFIYIHVYKTGGTSIRNALAPYSHDPSRTLVRRGLNKLGLQPPSNGLFYRYRDFYKHARAKELRQQLPQHVYASCFKFAFVRNPWDVQVSMYHYVLSDPNHCFYPDVSRLGGFEAFMEWIVKRYRKLQKDFVVDDDGKLIVDFVGRFESLEADFEAICDEIGIEAKLPHTNSTSHDDFTAYYTPRARRLVEEHYREDLEFFGYTFEDAEECHA